MLQRRTVGITYFDNLQGGVSIKTIIKNGRIPGILSALQGQRETLPGQIAMRLKVGTHAPEFCLRDLVGQTRCLSDYLGRRLWLSFHRYAACPLCNLHVHELSGWHDRLKKQGVDVVAVFRSGAQRVAEQYESRSVPFPVLSDSTGEVYGQYGIETSLTGMLKAFVLPRAMKAFFSGFMPGKIDADARILPADFLIDADGLIRRVFYAADITQHLALDVALDDW